MPRSSRGSAPRAASRPAPPPARPAQQQARPMSTTAQPGTAMQAGQKQPAQQGSGLFGQMASTAAGVAVGSSIGHALGGFFGGGSSSQAPADTYQQPAESYAQPGQTMDSSLYNTNYGSNASRNEASGPCATDIKTFTDCMNQNSGDLNVCGWYLEQLKACQMAARQY